MASKIDYAIDSIEKENVHEYLRSWTNKFTENILCTKDNTFKSLKKLKQNDDIVLLNSNKESCVIILSKIDYVDKVNKMIQDGITKGVYEVTTDNTHKDLASFQNFLYRHFKCHPDYDKMRPSSNQPARFFATAKTHKFDKFKDINIENLKLRAIIEQTGAATYNASKSVANYLRPLTNNKFVIKDCLLFPDILKSTVLENDEEIVSYDAQPLFTNIPIKETIDYICDEIYKNNALEPMCKKSMFRKLLYKLPSQCVFSVNNQLIK